MMTVAGTRSFDFGSAEYRDLFRRANVSAFQHPDWLTAFYGHLVKERGAEPLVVVGRSSATGKLSAVIPLTRRTEGETAVVEYAYGGVTDYACPVVDAELVSHPVGIPRFQQRLGRALGRHDVLRIQPVRQADAAVWEDLLGTAPVPMGFGAHSVAPGAPYRQWRAGNLGAARRSQLDRKLRRLSDRGAVQFCLLPADKAAEAMNWARQRREGRFPHDPIRDMNVLEFYREVAATGGCPGLARTYELSCGDDRVAICFGLVDGDRYCYLVLACDYKNYARYSPGILTLDMAIADWAAGGGGVFDFTIGDEPFKRVFRCTRIPIFKFEQARTERGRQHLTNDGRPAAGRDCRDITWR